MRLEKSKSRLNVRKQEKRKRMGSIKGVEVSKEGSRKRDGNKQMKLRATSGRSLEPGKFVTKKEGGIGNDRQREKGNRAEWIKKGSKSEIRGGRTKS